MAKKCKNYPQKAVNYFAKLYPHKMCLILSFMPTSGFFLKTQAKSPDKDMTQVIIPWWQ